MSSETVKITVEDSDGDLMTMTLGGGMVIEDLYLKLETVPAFLGYHPANIAEAWHPDVQSVGHDV